MRLSEDMKRLIATYMVKLYSKDNIHEYFTNGTKIIENPQKGFVNIKDIVDVNYCWDEFDYYSFAECLNDYPYYREQLLYSNCTDMQKMLMDKFPDVWSDFVDQQKHYAYEFFLDELPDYIDI
jgi:hypothetical protein